MQSIRRLVGYFARSRNHGYKMARGYFTRSFRAHRFNCSFVNAHRMQVLLAGSAAGMVSTAPESIDVDPAIGYGTEPGSRRMMQAALATVNGLSSAQNDLRHRAEAKQRAAEFVTQQCIIQGIPGCTVAVIKNGQLIWSYCYGYGDVANNVLLTPYSVMRIASITKPLTATAIAVLIQKGKLQVDETVHEVLERLDTKRAVKIREYIKTHHPRFYEDCKTFTILNLCNHTSGIRHYNNSNEYLSSDHYDSLVKVLANFADEELMFTPGQQYYYSSYGYIMLGLIIEAVSNVKYADFMKDEVVKPLRMTHTFLEMDDKTIIPNQSRQYVRDYAGSDGKVSQGQRFVYEVARYQTINPFPMSFPSWSPSTRLSILNSGGERRPKYKDTKIRKLRNAPYSDSTIKLSSGGFLSCAVDVALFGHQVVLGNLLTNPVKKLVFETNLIIRPKGGGMITGDEDEEDNNDDVEGFGYKDIEYGLGWHVYRKAIDPLTYNVEEICHGGGANGGCAHLLVLPQQELVVAVLMNLQQAKPTISRDIADFFKDACC